MAGEVRIRQRRRAARRPNGAGASAPTWSSDPALRRPSRSPVWSTTTAIDAAAAAAMRTATAGMSCQRRRQGRLRPKRKRSRRKRSVRPRRQSLQKGNGILIINMHKDAEQLDVLNYDYIVRYKVESRKSAILATHKKSANSNRTQSNYKS
jgi:hypothetical protein